MKMPRLRMLIACALFAGHRAVRHGIFLNGKATHLVAAVCDCASGKIAAEAEVAVK